MTLVVNPILLGVLGTLFVEMAAIIIFGIYMTSKDKGDE